MTGVKKKKGIGEEDVVQLLLDFVCLLYSETRVSREAKQNNAKPDPCYVTDYAKLCPPGSCLWEVKPGSQKMSRRFSIMSLRTPRWELGEDDPVKTALGDMLFIQPEDEPSDWYSRKHPRCAQRGAAQRCPQQAPAAWLGLE